MNPSAERGGVSRPSSSAWTRTSGTPRRAASPASATRCRSLAWTPPGPMRLTTWSRPSAWAARSHAASSAGPLEERAVGDRRVDPGQVLEDRPVRCPRLRWPTSELPIWPGGRPTASSDARRIACGQRSSRERQTGIGAAAIASADGSRPIPKPSRTTRTIGRGRRASLGRVALGRSRHPAPPVRAAAVSPARATIPAISSGLSEAPPTSAPSIAGSARNSPMLARRDAAAVEDRHRGAEVDQAGGRDRGPDRVGHRRGIGPGRVPPGPDRPDRLVGDDRATRVEVRRGVADRRVAEGRQDPVDLAADHRLGPTGLALVELLADAHDRPEAGLDRPAQLATDELVGLAGVAAPLRVADDHPASPGRPASGR